MGWARRAGVALVIAAVGCSSGGGSAPSSSGSSRGAPGATFTVTVRGETPYFDPTSAATIFLPEGGLVTASGGSAPISCGLQNGVASVSCSAEYAWGDAVSPAIVGLTAVPHAGSGYGFFAFAGSCVGSGACVVTGNADRLVVVRFARTQAGLGGHPNFSDAAVHGRQYFDYARGAPGALDCTECHGANLQGQGLAVSCAGCHAWPRAGAVLTWDLGSWDDTVWE
jgi:hypothetical protein